MQYTIVINQDKAIEWELDVKLAALFSFVYELPSWATTQVFNDEVYYFISKAKLAEELPILTEKPDTLYRYLRKLQEKGLIVLASSGPRTLVKLTKKATEWNRCDTQKDRNNIRPRGKNLGQTSDLTSDKHPTNLGQTSDLTSDKHPTDQYTKSVNQSDNHNHKGKSNPDFSSWPAEPSSQVFADYKKTRKAALTQTAVNRMAKELHLAAEAGYSVDDCLSECCERGWRGFKFEWLARSRGQLPSQSGTRPQQRHTQITGDNVGAGMTENDDGTLNF